MQKIGGKKFAAAALDLGKKVFAMHMAYLGLKMLICPTCEAQISLLVAEKVIILTKYSDFSDIFSKKSVAELLKRSDINKHSIDLELGK